MGIQASCPTGERVSVEERAITEGWGAEAGQARASGEAALGQKPEQRRGVSVGCPGGSAVKNLPATHETLVHSLGGEDPLEKEMAAHSSVLGNPVDRGAWGQQSMRRKWDS